MATAPTFWRRQTVVGGNYPPIPSPSTGLPYFPQIMGALEVLGRLNGTGPVERIPMARLADAVIVASLTPRIITGNTINVLASDKLIVIKKAAPAATTINLPSVDDRTVRELEIYDWAGNAGDITINPHAGETIMGLTSWVVGSGGVAGSGGSIRLISCPEASLRGWTAR